MVNIGDLFRQLRITDRPCEISYSGGIVKLNYSEDEDLKQLSSMPYAFQVISAPYAETND